jgi:hypothetical protein
MPELDRYSQLIRKIEHLVKYARAKRALFRTKAWIPQSAVDAVVTALPAAGETEKRILGEAIGDIVTSPIPKSASRSGEFPGFFVC